MELQRDGENLEYIEKAITLKKKSRPWIISLDLHLKRTSMKTFFLTKNNQYGKLFMQKA